MNVFCIICYVQNSDLQYIYTKVDPRVQESAAQKAVERILGDRHSEIEIRVNPLLTGSIFQEAFLVNIYHENKSISLTKIYWPKIVKQIFIYLHR